MNELTLIIPAKNEAESLPIVLNELKKYNYKINIVLHITDIATIQVIKKYDVNIIYQKNLGYGDALIQGIKQCKTKYFCIFNADGSFNPSEINQMLKTLQSKKLDFIFASRYQTNSGSEDDTIVTLIGNYIFTYIGKIFFQLNISDILYTFIIGRTEQANILNLKQKDFSFCVELPIKAKRMKMKLGCIDSYERKRIAGKKKVNAFKDGFLILKHMIRLFFTKL
jgi:glycosyltransferase involved in cell wall biosynthesis